MKNGKLVRFASYTLVVFVVLVIALVATVYILSNQRLHKKYSVQVRTVSIPSTAEAIEAGKHIADIRGCTVCHGLDFSGQPVIDNAMIGHLHGPNVTRGKGGLPAGFSDQDFVRAIRHGIGSDGHPLILMPSLEYSVMTDTDLGELIAYLKSRPPVDKPNGPVQPGPLGRVLILAGQIKIAAEHIDHATAGQAVITPAISVEYGRYMASSCVGCHGDTLGGGKIPGGPPDWPPSANLSPDPSSPIHGWTEAQFIQTIRTGKRPDGTRMSPVMPRGFAALTDIEIKALWKYIQSIPPVATGRREL